MRPLPPRYILRAADGETRNPYQLYRFLDRFPLEHCEAIIPRSESFIGKDPGDPSEVNVTIKRFRLCELR